MRRAAGMQLAPPTAVPCAFACAGCQAGKRGRKGAAEQAWAVRQHTRAGIGGRTHPAPHIRRQGTVPVKCRAGVGGIH